MKKSIFEGKVQRFKNSLSTDLVKIIVTKQDFYDDGETQHFSFNFDVKLDLNQKYIDYKKYESGNAFIYLSESFYDDAITIAVEIFNASISWNNTKTSGMIKKRGLR